MIFVIAAAKFVITNEENCDWQGAKVMVGRDSAGKCAIQVAQVQAVRLHRTCQRKGIQHG